MAWLSRNDLSPSDRLYADQLNSLSNDVRAWGGNVNGGGNHLSNVILDSTVVFPSAQTPWASNIDGAGHDLNNAGAIQARFNINIAAATVSTPYGTLVFSDVAGTKARWDLDKTIHPETGANAGSDLQINRYNDDGTFLGDVIYLHRNTGNIFIRNSVGIGGSAVANPAYTLDVAGDCNISGTYRVNGTPLSTGGGGAVSSVFSRTGAVLAAAGDYSLFYVPLARQVIAGSGLSGGGALSGNVTLTAVPLGPSGGSHTAGIVPDPGVTAGATRYLREDATWAIPSGAGGGIADPTTTKGDLLVRSSSAVTRLGVATTDTWVLTADSTQTLGMRWAPPTGGGGGGSQTPWASDIDAGGFQLTNAGMITAKNIIQIRQGASNISRLYFQSPTGVNRWSWSTFVAETGGNVGSEFLLDRFADDGSFLGSALFVRRQTGHVYVANNLGLGVDPPAYKLDVAGDINISTGSSYRIGGIPISTGGGGGTGPTTQTSWGARTLSTSYQNTGTKPIYSAVILTVPAGSTTVALCDAASSPTTTVAEVDVASAAGASVITLFFIVLPAYYQRVTATAGSTIYKWTEWT